MFLFFIIFHFRMNLRWFVGVLAILVVCLVQVIVTESVADGESEGALLKREERGLKKERRGELVICESTNLVFVCLVVFPLSLSFVWWFFHFDFARV